MARYIDPRPQYFDDSGDPLAFGKVYIYESGSSTLKDIFSDDLMELAAENPVILSGSGRLPNTWFDGSARAKLTDADEVQFWDIDPIGSAASTGALSDWNSTSVYNIPDLVTGDNDKFYTSITDTNQGNNPTTDTNNWSEVKFTGVYNANQAYVINDVAQGTDGLLYKSNVNSNSGNDPVSDPVNWSPVVEAITTVYEDQAYWMGL